MTYEMKGRPSTIYRVAKNKDNPYVMIDKRPIENPALSYKAKGILAYLMSRPDGWEVNITDLDNRSTDGRSAIRSGLKELRDAGHMRYTPVRANGKISQWIIEVFEVPLGVSEQNLPTPQEDPENEENDPKIPPELHDDYLQVENLHNSNLNVENRTQYNNELSNNNLSNTSAVPAGEVRHKKPKPVLQRQDLSIEGQIFISDSPVVMPNIDVERARKIADAANLIDMGCAGAGALASSFMNARGLIFTNSDVKRERKHARELLEKGVKPEHVSRAVFRMTNDRILQNKEPLTCVSLGSVSKIAIDLANEVPDVKIDNTPPSGWSEFE